MTKSEPTPESAVEKDSDKPVRTNLDAASKKSSFKTKLRSLVATKKRRILLICGAAVLLLAVLFAIPATRYAIAGTVIKKNTTISVVDAATGKPASEVNITLAGQTRKTNGKGEVTFLNVPVGQYVVKAEKKYFRSGEQNITVPVLAPAKSVAFSLKATGRQVLVKVINRVSGTPLGNATVAVSDTKATTDKNGEAAIVLPIRSKPQAATVTRDGFNVAQLSIIVVDKADQKAETGLMPAGKIYYLSKRTGKINVVKSNLDGTEPQTVVEGTGRESDHQTVLLASRDWKYLALHAKRDSDKPKLYLINTTNDKLTVIDEGNASFNLVGWSGHRFIFTVDRTKPNYWDDKKQALKSYDAGTGKIATLDETKGGGTNQYNFAYEAFSTVYITNDRLVYAKDWGLDYNSSYTTDKKLAFMSVKPEGGNQQRLREFNESNTTAVSLKAYAPDEIYFQLYQNGKSSYYEYEDGGIKDVGNIDEEKFNSFYPTYLVSPGGDKTFWYEPRDGKNTLLVGDKAGSNSREIATVSEYTPYGWFSDEYLLVSKAGSELYIMSRTDPKQAPVKVSDYHKPQLNYPGYGYGYGGQ